MPDDALSTYSKLQIVPSVVKCILGWILNFVWVIRNQLILHQNSAEVLMTLGEKQLNLYGPQTIHSHAMQNEVVIIPLF